MTERKLSRQRRHQKRQAEINKDVRALRNRYYEAFTVTKVPKGFYVEWEFTPAQDAVIEDAARRHGMDVETFLRLLGQAVMNQAPRSLRRKPETVAS